MNRIFVITALILAIAFGYNAKVFAAPLYADVVVEGNDRISDENVKVYFNAPYTKDSINESIKKMYRSGYFKDIEVDNRGDKLIVKVLETPLVNNVTFKGNKEIDEDTIKAEVDLRKRATFSQAKLQSDVVKINNLYVKKGRFSTQINPEVTEINGNRVDIVFNIKESKEVKIKKVFFEGNNEYVSRDLKREIFTRAATWHKPAYREIYDPSRIQYDKELLNKFYTSKGYADFETISSETQITPDRKAFYLTFLLDEGRKYRFGKIDVVNKIASLDDSVFDKSIETKKGKLYNSEDIERSIYNMNEKMGEFGYAFVEIEPVLDRDKDNDIIDLTYVINPAPRVYINKINISGNTRTMDEVIRRELRIKEGDPYNTTRIRRSQQRVRNLGFFSDAKFDIARTNVPDKVDINISVVEQKTGEFNFGIGYSTSDKAIANVSIKERNLMGTGREVYADMQKSKYKTLVNLGYNKPYFMDRDIKAGFGVFYDNISKQDSVAYDKVSIGGTLRANYSISERLTQELRYSYMEEDIKDIDEDYIGNIEEGTTTASLIGQTLLYDKRDNVFNPTSGYYARLSQDMAGFGGDKKYLRNNLSAGYYVPVFNEDFVLKFGLKGGYIYGMGDDIYVSDLYYLGGDSLRGFKYAGVGSRDKDSGDIVGGDYYYTGVSEFKFPLGLPKEMGMSGSVFYNAGTVGGVDNIRNVNSDDLDHSDSIRSAWGYGVTWASPMGLMRFDFSNVIDKEDYDKSESFRFSFGYDF